VALRLSCPGCENKNRILQISNFNFQIEKSVLALGKRSLKFEIEGYGFIN
jgi:hypothetical protein